MTTVADIAPKADPDWISCALTAIAALARTGQQFTASDVADLMGREPEHSRYWGSALAAAKRDGLIVSTGITVSRRRSRNSGYCRTWRGTAAA